MKNALNWFELPAGNFERAKKFYEDIFNYKMFVLDLGSNFKMGFLPFEEKSIGGAVVWNEGFYKPGATEGPLVYLNGNPDLIIILNHVETAGGKIIIPKRQVSPQFGYMAVFIDSEGNRVALHSNS
ncbi:MAG: VOC family protein [Chitinophagales bacterium]|nr:VOC family protein [Chitinophagales bacterium]